MGLPKRVSIYEVGPREGFQIETNPISTEEKISFINSLNKTGLSSIEVTSFVSPKWVPNMADAEKVLQSIEKKENVDYRAVYLNIKGLQRAFETDVTVDGVLLLTASDTFSKKNTNKSIQETFEKLPDWIEAYQSAGIPVNQLALMATFGCNYEGNIYSDNIINILRQARDIAAERGEKIVKIKLADTMGWANPEQIKKTIHKVRNEWPEMNILLHLHDTRGLGLANAHAALEEGVTEFETAVAGLGGCPFAAVKGAAGNISTEDFAFMCEEMGVETGLILDELVHCAQVAEKMIGRQLPGHLSTGGLFTDARSKTWIQQEEGWART